MPSDCNIDILHYRQTSEGGHVGDDCGTVIFGKSAVFCDSAGPLRDLVSGQVFSNFGIITEICFILVLCDNTM